MTLLIAGVLALDDLQTPHRSGKGIVGGAGVYASLAASHFTEPVLVGPIGRDFPQATLEKLSLKGVNVACVKRVDAPSFHWSGEYTGDMAQAVTHHTRVDILDRYDWEIPPEYRTVRLLLLCNNDPQIQLKVLEQVNADCVACDTMNLWIDIARERLDEVVSRTNILFINDAEAAMYTGTDDLVTAAKALMTRGPRFIIIKLGARGAVFFGENFRRQIPAFRVKKLVDPTGAGDSFAGATMGYLAQADELSTTAINIALLYGTAVASSVVEGFGTESIIEFSREAVEERFEALKAR